MLKEGFVLRDLEAYRAAPQFTENERLFNEYPGLATELVSRLFTVDGTPPVHVLSMVLGQIREQRINMFQLAMDGWKGARNL
jgi:electron transfer flavoprotein-quinone oxidoreductase